MVKPGDSDPMPTTKFDECGADVAPTESGDFYLCTLHDGHDGPQHVASGARYVIATRDIETGETEVA